MKVSPETGRKPQEAFGTENSSEDARSPRKFHSTFLKWPNWFLFLSTLLLLVSIALNIYVLTTRNKDVPVNYPQIPFLHGWTQKSVRQYNTSNGHFPEVTEYLHPVYIQDHLRKFAFGASVLYTDADMSKFGELIGDSDNTLFVTSSTDMDVILVRANGNVTLIEEALGIPYGLFKGRKIIRVNVPTPYRHNLRMATGNEVGANELWLPGGYLPTGISEAILNRVAVKDTKQEEVPTF